MQIRQLQVNEYDKALTLSLDVFIQCGKNDFDEEGLKTFKSFIYNKDLVNELTIYGAFEGESLIGLIATKNEGKHISLFFITPMYHGKGIGKRLFEAAIQDKPVSEMTVNSSSYAIPIYRKFGFEPICEEQTTHGMKYTPMRRTITRPSFEDFNELLLLWEASVRSTHHFLKEEDIHEILFYVQGNQERKAELYDLIFDPDDAVSYQALWVCSHFSTKENEWLYDKQDELINEVLNCKHSGKRRILLNLLVRQPQTNPPRVDFLNFCLDRMLSAKELPGVQTLCMKLGYELCRPIPELLLEYKTLLDLAEPDLLQISLRTVRKNILKKYDKT